MSSSTCFPVSKPTGHFILSALTFLAVTFSAFSLQGASVEMVIGERITATENIDESDNLIIVNRTNGRVVTIEGNILAPGSNVKVEEFSDTTRVLWFFRNQGGNSFEVRSSAGGRDIGVDGRSTTEGANVQSNEGGGEAWDVEEIDDGYFRIINSRSNKDLSVNGDNLVQNDYTGSSGQQWAIHQAATSSSEEPNFDMIGWATTNGGTTGGAGGPEVTVSTPTEFMNEIVKERPRIIKVSGTLDFNTIDLSDWTGYDNQWGNRVTATGSDAVGIRPSGDLSILGLGDDAEIRGAEIRLGPGSAGREVDDPKDGNFIIRNIKFVLDAYRKDPTVSETAIILQAGVGYVWIDHCEFEDDPNHPDPDGAIDAHRGAKYFTISWNRFTFKSKAILLASTVGFSDDFDSIQTTWHHNWFESSLDDVSGSTGRNPRMTVGKIHLLNNFWENRTAGRVHDQHSYVTIYDERNYRSSRSHQFAFHNDMRSLEWGGWNMIESIGRRAGYPEDHVGEINTGINWNPADEYEYTANHPLNVPYLVRNYSGRGIIDPSNSAAPRDDEDDPNVGPENDWVWDVQTRRWTGNP